MSLIYDYFFFKNIFSKIMIFHFSGYKNCFNSNHHLVVYFFLKSPFVTLSKKIKIINFSIIHYDCGRFSCGGKTIKIYKYNIDVELDDICLPKLSLKCNTQVNHEVHKTFNSYTYYPIFSYYFEFYNSLVKENFTYRNPPLKQNFLMKYFFIFNSIHLNKNHVSYLNSSYYKTDFFNPSVSLYQDNLFRNNYKLENKNITFSIKQLKDEFVIRNYSFVLKFVVIPYFTFEIPTFFFLEYLNYSNWSINILNPPFMLFIFFWRYLKHRKFMISKFIRTRGQRRWSNTRNDYASIKFFPVFRDPPEYNIVIAANKYQDPWIWGKVRTNYPKKGGDCFIW